VPWLRRLAAGLPPPTPGFDPGSVHVGFMVDKVALEQVFPRVLRFPPVSFIPSVLHYQEKDKKIIFIFITGLHNKPHGCSASVASAAGPFTTKKKYMARKRWSQTANRSAVLIILMFHRTGNFFKVFTKSCHSTPSLSQLNPLHILVPLPSQDHVTVYWV
jgi:hypothetical protein